MGKVIEFDPSRRKKKETEKEPEGNKPIDLGEGFKKIIDGMGENEPAGLMMELLLSQTMLHDKIEEIRRNTEGFSRMVFPEKEEAVRKLTNSELIYRLTKSNSAEWHKDPAYYRAVANEVLERLEMITRDDK